MSISRIFDLSKRSLETYQRALDITAHNISNASNPDYSRQRIQFQTEAPEVRAGFVWGTGVDIDSVNRVRNQLTDTQIILNNQKYSNNSKRSDILSQVEKLFSEPTDLGLASLTNNFFNSWSQLAVNPSSISLRNDVIYQANKLSAKVQDIHDNLDTIKADIRTQVDEKIKNVNNYLKNIQDLNKQIFESSGLKYSPNDLLDQRDKAIEELSKLVNINVTYDNTNTALITVGGIFAVDRSTHTEFQSSIANNKLALQTTDGVATTLTGGELYALTDLYSNSLPQYQTNLDSIVSTIMNSVNSEHVKGYSINTPPEAGINFFESYSNGVLKINSQITADPQKIAVSADGTNGNGDIAIKIADLSKQALLNGTTISDNYNALISQVANDKSQADQNLQANNIILQQLQQLRSSQSGVSIDEEMTNVIKFQRSYDASAKLIKVADDMLQTLLNMV